VYHALMPRPPRITEPRLVYHILNRRVMRMAIFRKDRDYAAFEAILGEALSRADAPRLLAYCLMPNHWHLIVRAGPRSDLSTWMQWLAVTHTHRWHAHHHSAGQGPLYQGRFKCFPIQADAHFLIACRYVEANASRAGLVARAETWPWCSAWLREQSGQPSGKPVLSGWPVDRPRNWLAEVNREIDEEGIKGVQQCVVRGTPLGGDLWRQRVAERLGLDLTLRGRGRPRRDRNSS
jgi:putative transposase